ncbi:2391_t:CDS:2 [Entrophospora sp. SA101]|nr:2391_t:CDS:2 [Entrophospora sp. SA101]
MENNSLSTKEKYGLLQAAVKAHSEYTRDASNGKGCDRHLLGLRLLLKEGESHPLFQHPIFAKSQEWLLSTSGLTTGTKFNGTGFGCVYPNEYESPDFDNDNEQQNKVILNLMQELQELGQPPPEILQDFAPDLSFDENGLPNLSNADLPSNCKPM